MTDEKKTKQPAQNYIIYNKIMGSLLLKPLKYDVDLTQIIYMNTRQYQMYIVLSV